MKRETVIVLDFGGQYNQLIARRVRECNVYAEVHPYTMSIDEIKKMNPKGIIFTGGPNSVYKADSPSYSKEIFELGIPILGICYGSQLMAHVLGGKVATAPVSEYGRTEVMVDKNSILFKDVNKSTICWMSHTDYIAEAPEGFVSTATTPNCPFAAMENADKNLYATQFHPEVMHTEEGMKMLRAFVMDVCKCSGDWKMDSFVEDTIKSLREKIGNGKVLCALSGGVDSSVAAVLLSKAVGKQLTCVFVDQGLLRKNEGDEVEAVFGPDGPYDLNFIRVNAQDRFYQKLAGVVEPEAKRKIIGEEFIRVFEEEAKKIGAVDFLAQALQMALHRAVQALAAHIQPQAAQHAGVYGLGQDDIFACHLLQFCQQFFAGGSGQCHSRYRRNFQNAVILIVTVPVGTQHAGQFPNQIFLAQKFEEVDKVRMRPLERLVQQGAALFFRYAGRCQQALVLRLGLDAVHRSLQFLQKLLGQFFLGCQVIQASAVHPCSLGHDASPTFLINSSIRS